jgi:hypothetical protein
MGECIHELDPAWCATCKDNAKPRTRWEATGFKMQARFSGPCRDCHAWIDEGDTIVQQKDVNQLLEDTRFVCREH